MQFSTMRSLALMGLVGAGVPIAGTVLSAIFIPDWRLDHYPAHALVETLGAVCGLSIAVLILIMRSHRRLDSHYLWIAVGLTAMSVLDLVHAALHAGQPFVWTHSLATFLGGACFALVWLPERLTNRVSGPWLVAAAGLTAALIGAHAMIPGVHIPGMVAGGEFTTSARALNMLGGIGFLACTAFLLTRMLQSKGREARVFSTHALLFGVAGLLFETSQLWDGAWWLWHVLRAIAYLVALHYFASVFSRMADDLREQETELKQRVSDQTLELRAALIRAEEANRLKSEFLANMSHEIRTPLNGVIGMTQLMLTRTQDDAERGDLEVIRGSSNHLLNLINNILDISRIEANAMELEQAPFHLEDVMTKARNSVLGIAHDRGLELHLKSDLSTCFAVRGDAARLHQILVNLLGNALKFTERGQVTLIGENRGSHVYLAVQDTGPGIPEKDQADIFERFRQVEDGKTNKPVGSGLGLTISRELVRMMEGEIGVESTPGEGTTFWLTIPFETVTSSDAMDAEDSTAANPAPDTDLTGCRLLIAEDNMTNQLILRAFFERQPGVQFDIVENGADALEALAVQTYDIALFDVNMPTLSGDAALASLRDSDLPCRDMPVLMLTANALESQRAAYLAAGANGVLTKPIDFDELLTSVAAALRDASHPASGLATRSA